MPLLNPDKWRRAGRGRNLQFYATDDEVHEALRAGVGAAESHVVAMWSERGVDGTWVDRFSAEPWQEWRKLYEPGRVWQFFFTPPGLEPRWFDDLTALSRVQSAESVASVNGWLILQHGHHRRGKQRPSSVGVVDRVINAETREAKQWSDSRVMFDRTAKFIRARLQYATLKRARNGEEYVDDKVCLMTAGAAAQSSHFDAAVGPRLP